MQPNQTYNNFEHTSKISLRTYTKIIPSEAPEESRKIISEGSYRIGLLFSTRVDDPATCTLIFGEEKVLLIPTFTGANVINPQFIFWLDGNVNTVRDDEILVQFTEPSENSSLIVIYDRIVWKKDDNFYPAQANDKSELDKLNHKR